MGRAGRGPGPVVSRGDGGAYWAAMGRPPAPLVAAGILVAGVLAAGILVAGSRDGGGSEEAFCAALPDVPPLGSVLDQLESQDRDAAQGSLAATVERYEELDDAAPSEINGDVATVVALVTEIADALAVDAEDPVTAGERLAAIDPDTEEVAESAERIATYAAERCDIVLNPATTVLVPTSPPATDATTTPP